MNFLSTLIFIYLDPCLSHSIKFQCFTVVTFFLGIFFTKWRKFATKKVSGYAFDISNECVAYERFQKELGTLPFARGVGDVALCKMCFYFV